MAILDPATIRFSNEYLRKSANLIARAYYKAHETADKWNALGGTNAEKLGLLYSLLGEAANKLTWMYRFCDQTRLFWDALNMQANIPNDPAEELWDNETLTGQDPTRPPVSGQDLRRLNWRIEESVNWLKYDPLVADPVFVKDADLTTEVLTYTPLKDAMRLDPDSPEDPTGAWAAQLIVRCQEIVTHYETTQPAWFNHVLAVAPLPGQLP